ncbi:hypothetical protein ACJX0J_037340 [Zea mays]
MGVIVPTVLKILTLALLRAKTAALFSSTSFFTFKEIAEKDGNMCYPRRLQELLVQQREKEIQFRNLTKIPIENNIVFIYAAKWSFLSEQDYYIHQVLSIIKKTLKSKTQHFSHARQGALPFCKKRVATKITIESDEDQYRDAQQ